MIGRPVFQQPIFARQNERYVNSERELRLALNDAASRVLTANGCSIVICQDINLKQQLVLTAQHSGLTIRGLNRNITLSAAQGVTIPVLVDITGGSYFFFEKLTVSNPASSGTAIKAAGGALSLSLTECFPRANVPLNIVADSLNIKGCFFNGADNGSGSASLAITVNSGVLCESSFFSSVVLTSTNFFRVVGNFISLNLTLANACTGISITGNVFSSPGVVNTSLGGGSSVIVGNHLAGATLTTVAGDISASNHA